MNAITRMGCGVLASGLLAGAAQAQTLVGRTEGAAGVSATGAAEYAIPLALPPGTNGVTPTLAVTFDSRGGNGLLGVGFRIAGFSVVERCARTLAQDGTLGAVALGRNDRFCLDGKRLRLTAGTYGYAGSQYQTEVEEFSRVTALGTAGNGPASFQVERRDGLIYEYGGTSDARIESSGSSTARAWALNRIRDRSGNAVEFTYVEDTVSGAHRPSRIDYTSNTALGSAPYYSVRFVYEPRPAADVLSGYVAGGAVLETQRLDRIDVVHVASGSLVRRFDFAYASAGSSSRSRLASVQECGPTQCLAPTTFGWINASPGWGGWDTGLGLMPGNLAAAFPGDSDGDGCEDLTYFDKVAGRWMVLRGNAVGYAGPALNAAAGSAMSAAETISIDLDADGKRDLLVPGAGADYKPAWLWLHHTTASTYVYTATGVAKVSPAGGIIAADIDGDGREDLVYIKANVASIFWRRNVTGAGVPAFAAEAVLWTSPYGAVAPQDPFGTEAQRFRSIVRQGDFNRDGRADLLFLQQYSCGTTPDCFGTRSEWHALVSTGTSLESRAIINNAAAVPELSDFNGDGLTDVAYPVMLADTSVVWRLRFSTGAEAATAATFTAEVATSVKAPTSATIVADWDGDGRTDLMFRGADGTWQYCRSTGTQLAACQSTGLSTPDGAVLPIVTDVNGDGQWDLVYAAGEYRYRPGAARADLLSTVTDALGNAVRFAYAYTTDRSVHVPFTGSVFPVREFSTPLAVVSRINRSDAAGGTYDTKITYEGARLHLQGRGWLGFARRALVDSRTGLVRVEEYQQDPANFELLGLPASVAVRQAAGTSVHRDTYTWSRFSYGAGYEARRFPYLATTVSDRHELDGTRVTSTSTRNTFDAFGTLTDQAITLTELARGSNPGAQHTRRVTLSGVVNDTTNWCFGRPAVVTERRSHTLAGGAELVRNLGRSWDYAHCRSNQEVIEPSSANLRVTIDYAYDAWGNRSAEVVTPAGEAARRSAFGWTESGRFIGTLENPAGHVTTFTWDPVMARRVQARDPNGRVTRWVHDDLNRVTRETAPDGTGVSTQRTGCNGGACAWPGAAYAVTRVRRGVGDAYIASDETGHDALDREVYAKHELPGGVQSIVVQRYDSLGRLSQRSAPTFCCAQPTRWTSFTYDLLGRRLSEERPTSDANPAVVATRWRHDGLSVAVTDALGRVSTQRLDASGNVIQAVDPAGADTDYEYDAFGNLVKVRDFFNNETSLVYNARGLRTEVLDPDAGRWTFGYSALGELRTQTNARGQVVSHTYDALGRPVSRVEPEGTTTWVWGASAAAANIGALASVSSPGFQESYTYDSLGRPKASTRSVSGTSLVTGYSYDATTGLLDTLTYPSVVGAAPLRVKHRFDRGRLVALSDADSTGTVFWTLDAANALGVDAGVTLGNGVRIASSYDTVSAALTARAAGPAGGSSYQNLQYAWDAVGNLASRTDATRGVIEQFVYDSRDRLDYVRRSGATTLDVAYDELGNITYKSDVGSYRYDTTHKHAVVAAGANTYAYDADGVMTAANGTTFSWYTFDLPKQLSHSNGNYAAFYYGPDRARYRQVSRAGASLSDTVYAMDGLYERTVRDGSTVERAYIAAGDGIVAVRSRVGAAAPTVVYLLKDHLGSVDAFTSASGALLARTSYQPFGARRSGDWLSASPTAAEWQQITGISSRGYTQHEHLDNLGLIHMNGRVFDAVLGRFLSPDPVVQAPYDGQGWNRYSYVRNNPLRYTDPSGFCSYGHPAYDQAALRCLENVTFQYWSLSSLQLDQIQASAAQAAQAAAVVQAGAVNGSAGVPLEQIVVTAPRSTEPDIFAVDASMYARFPQWLVDAATSRYARWAAIGMVGLLAALEPTPIGEGVISSAAVSSGATGTDFVAVATPYGQAVQSLSPAALAARGRIASGATLWRMGTMGRSAAGEAQFWALEQPFARGFATRYGIPAANVARFDFIESGTLRAGTSFVTRVAPGIGANIGGGIEAVVPEGAVILHYFGTY